MVACVYFMRVLVSVLICVRSSISCGWSVNHRSRTGEAGGGPGVFPGLCGLHHLWDKAVMGYCYVIHVVTAIDVMTDIDVMTATTQRCNCDAAPSRGWCMSIV